MVLAAVNLDTAGVLAMLLQGRSGMPSMADPTDALLLLLVWADKRWALGTVPAAWGVE